MEICYQKRNEQRKKIEQRELKEEELQRQKKLQNIRQQDVRKHQELKMIVMDKNENSNEEDAENLDQGEEKKPNKIIKLKIK